MTTTPQLWELDRRSLWHPFTKHSALQGPPFPIIERGAGVWLTDTDGNRLFDAISSWWACNLGHNHPRIVAAIRDQAGRLDHSILGNLTHPNAIRLAARLLELFPHPRRRVFFASDGACGVEAALRIATQYWHNLGRPEKHRFAALHEGYHGDTIGAMSVGYLPSFHEPYKPLLFPVHQADLPDCRHCPHRRAAAAAAPFDPLACHCGVECFTHLETLLTAHAGELAAMIVEPHCQGAAGMRMYSPAWLRRLAELCAKLDILLIADEVAMGFGRTGRLFSFEHAGIDPDIVCLGKSLTGGTLPMSAAVVQERIFAAFADTPAKDGTLYHGHTFAGNPLAAAAALAALDVFAAEGIVERAAALSRHLAEAGKALCGLPGVENVRVLGAILACEVADAARAQAARQRLLGRGILLRPLGRTLYLLPPLVTTDADLRWLAEEFRVALAAAAGE
ncbi:MAG: adenosylmethionine--8-amino-7-oxononanoate transaminase [Lentisphaeria bacterium]|jgi:adenosylmethionine-8-amino-7-oxononanoate aminotransferase